MAEVAPVAAARRRRRRNPLRYMDSSLFNLALSLSLSLSLTLSLRLSLTSYLDGTVHDRSSVHAPLVGIWHLGQNVVTGTANLAQNAVTGAATAASDFYQQATLSPDARQSRSTSRNRSQV